MKVLDLFSGIGGFSLGLERAGMETVAFCEIEKYPRQVLKKHWPDIPIYEDVRNVTKERLDADGIFPDVITAGFPCQDISAAGNQAGIGEGTRSGLWSECARILGEFRHDIKYAVFENVPALLSGDSGKWFQRVLWDISEVGYDAEWHCIPASAVGAHHRRDRVWIIAYPNSTNSGNQRQKAGCGNELMGERETIPDDNGIEESMADSASEGLQRNLGRASERQRFARNCEDVANPNNQGLERRSKCVSDEPGNIRQATCGSLSDRAADVSYPTSERGRSRNPSGQDAKDAGQPSIYQRIDPSRVGGWLPEPTIRGVADGVSDGLYEGRITQTSKNRANRLKALGNSIVPQIAEIIGRAIMKND